MPKILFIAAHRPNRSPSQRYRFEQYFSFLEKNGYQCQLSYLINETDDGYFYSSGNYLRKISILLKSIFIRLNDLLHYNDYELVFVQREALMIGSTFFEKRIKSSRAKFIFDFDDSIWLNDTSDANKKFEWLKKPEKTATNIQLADLVFAGNSYLAQYALQFNKNVKIIPTTVNTAVHQKLPKNNPEIVIGWSGSKTTIKHFELAIPFLLKIKNHFGNKVVFKIMGDPSYANHELGIQGIKWSAETEAAVLNTFDIGIMPLPQDEWAKGKCGLKGLLYMAHEIPTIMSPVGVNGEIIKHGVNGFLAQSMEEWVSCISALIESPELRSKIGKAARQTVEEKYSVKSQEEVYLQYFNELLGYAKSTTPVESTVNTTAAIPEKVMQH